jgi:glycosyltransferase involved in cell wall biosynthesis
MYRIIFRTCDRVHSLHNTPRPFGLDKRGTIELCFRSLVQALEGYPHTIHIIADQISDELRQFFLRYPVTFTEGTFGNDESIRKSIRQALTYDANDWVYICEDDYLHTPKAFLWIDDLIENRDKILLTKPVSNLKRWRLADFQGRLGKHPLVIHTPDYIDRYNPREREQSYLFLSQYCHWRQITNTTFTFMTEVSTLKRFEKILMKSATGADDGFLSSALYARDHFFGRALCISPIPGVATHMHEGIMTRLVDWKRVIDELNSLK